MTAPGDLPRAIAILKAVGWGWVGDAEGNPEESLTGQGDHRSDQFVMVTMDRDRGEAYREQDMFTSNGFQF